MTQSLQNSKENPLVSSDRILAFKRKKKKAVKGNLETFPNLLKLESEKKY